MMKLTLLTAVLTAALAVLLAGPNTAAAWEEPAARKLPAALAEACPLTKIANTVTVTLTARDLVVETELQELTTINFNTVFITSTDVVTEPVCETILAPAAAADTVWETYFVPSFVEVTKQVTSTSHQTMLLTEWVYTTYTSSVTPTVTEHTTFFEKVAREVTVGTYQHETLTDFATATLTTTATAISTSFFVVWSTLILTITETFKITHYPTLTSTVPITETWPTTVTVCASTYW